MHEPLSRVRRRSAPPARYSKSIATCCFICSAVARPALLDRAYRKNALATQLRKTTLLFQQFDEATRSRCIDCIRNRVELVHVDPGQEIFHQGERADHFYLVRLGFVKVAQTLRGQTRVVDYLGPGRGFGEIGLLSDIQQIAAEHFPAGIQAGP